jgi:hypothetical protein
MTQFNPQYPGYPGAASPQMQPQRRRFPFFMGYVMWFSPALWRDVGRRWGGICFLYMLILQTASWAVDMSVWYPKLTAYARDEVPKIAAKVPAIEIKDGIATADVEQPYIIRDPDSGKALFVIDTTGATTEPPEVPSGLLTRDSLIIRDENKVQTLPLKELPPMSINPGTVQAAFDKIVGMFWPVGLPIAAIVWMILRLLQMLIYGLLAMAVGSGVRPPLGFAAGMRLAAIAITPVILLDTVLWAVGMPMWCFWWIAAPVLEIVLLVFMVRANDDPSAMPPGIAGGGYYPPVGGYPVQGYAQPAYAPPPPGYASPPPPPLPGYPPPR